MQRYLSKHTDRTWRGKRKAAALLLEEHGFSIETLVEVGVGIYGTPITADIQVFGAEDFPKGLLVECRWQNASGSVDQKFPYLVANIKQAFGLPTVVVLAGGGCSAGARAWMKSQVGGNFLSVLSGHQFKEWVESGLRRASLPR